MKKRFPSVLWTACVLALPALAVAACNAADQLASLADPPPVTPPLSTGAPIALSVSEGARQGIPFGTTAQPTGVFGAEYTGALRNIWPNRLLEELAAIKAQGGRVALVFAGSEKYYKSDLGHFDLSKWKARIDRFKGVDFSSYVDDGTIIGHYLIDEPQDPANWNKEPISGPALDEMAKYSKQLWPNMITIARTPPAYLAKWTGGYQYLDAAWAQYLEPRGKVNAFINDNVAKARSQGLGLIVGLNLTKGGHAKSTMNAADIKSWGSALLADPYPCAFLSWQYDAKYLGQRDVQEAMTSLAQKAREHPAKSCRGAAAGGETPPVTPPPPPPPLPVPPQAGFIAPDCTAGTVCQFSDGSTDADGTIASRTWNFGDQGTATDPNPAHTYASAGTYTITLSVTDDDGGTSSVSASLTVAATPLPNQSPTAAFTAPSCTASLPCRFTDGSADSDGSIVSRSWIFGPGASSSETNPSSVFAAAGTYLVTLIVTDDQGASSSIAQNVVVAAAPLPVIKAPVLSLRLIAKAGREYVRLTWTGASGATVDLYKNERREKVVNDGVVTRAPISAGPTTYSYRICEAGSTNCSNTTTVTLSSPTISLQVTGSSGDRRQRATLAWANATGSKVDVYRNGTLLKTTRNDGQFFDSQERRGPATDSYKVCQAATASCSNAVTVIFR